MKKTARSLTVVALILAFLLGALLVPYSQTRLQTTSPRIELVAAYPIDVRAPERQGDNLKASANLSLDCSGTLGCWNYMKIERKRAWGWERLDGNWATSNGWNTITTKLPDGCYDYKTTTDSYNDVVGDSGLGTNVGPVGVNANGQRIYKYKKTWSSGEVRICK